MLSWMLLTNVTLNSTYRTAGNLKNCLIFKLFLLQNKLKSSQREKVRQFVAFTNTGEKTAIHCLSMHDWRMDISTDNYFQHPEKYYKESKPSIDKKKLNSLFEKYKGELFTLCLSAHLG